MFDREREWIDLAAFAGGRLERPRLGLVYGRRRHGKTCQVSDPLERRTFELDVVALGRRTDGADGSALLAIGEAKASATKRSLADLARLDRLRGRLGARFDVGRTKLLLFGRSGFERGLLRAAKERPDVELVDLERLYEGA